MPHNQGRQAQRPAAMSSKDMPGPSAYSFSDSPHPVASGKQVNVLELMESPNVAKQRATPRIYSSQINAGQLSYTNPINVHLQGRVIHDHHQSLALAAQFLPPCSTGIKHAHQEKIKTPKDI